MQNYKKINKRINHIVRYFDDILLDYSKINVIRIDLAYKTPYSKTITIEEANKDLKHLLNNMRSKPAIFKDKIGYVIKKEYTQDRGVHFHILFIFNGQRVYKDSFKAEQIGQYWVQITQGRGSFHNCNRQKYDQYGIGIIDHKDHEKRAILYETVVPYLCKDEQLISALDSGKRDKALVKGVYKRS